MASTSTKRSPSPRSSPVRRAKAASAGKAKAAAKKPATAAAKKSVKAAAKKPATAGAKKPAAAVTKPVKTVAKTAGKKALKAIARGALHAGEEAIRRAADRTAELGRSTLESALSRRPPIQVSIDVAVPLVVAWKEWMTFDALTEGIHRIEDVERDGNRLAGRTAGPRSSEWAAEIVDEREQQSLAWRSVEATDCAGLVTFHRLSERLTRLELDLDVMPKTPAEMLALSSHLAHRRAQSDLRRFKARVEFINPDVYEAEASANGSGPASNDTD